MLDDIGGLVDTFRGATSNVVRKVMPDRQAEARAGFNAQMATVFSESDRRTPEKLLNPDNAITRAKDRVPMNTQASFYNSVVVKTPEGREMLVGIAKAPGSLAEVVMMTPTSTENGSPTGWQVFRRNRIYYDQDHEVRFGANREKETDIVTIDGASVVTSNHHFSVHVPQVERNTQQYFYVSDVSSNGTSVTPTQITPATLNDLHYNATQAFPQAA